MSDATRTSLSLGVPDELVEAIPERVADLIAEQPAKAEPSPWLDVEAVARYLSAEPHRIYVRYLDSSGIRLVFARSRFRVEAAPLQGAPPLATRRRRPLAPHPRAGRNSRLGNHDPPEGEKGERAG